MALLTLPAWADDLSPICPDRPGKGTSPCTLADGHVQVELGLFDESTQRRSGVTTDFTIAGSTLLKYGVSSDMDLEAGMALDQSQRVHSMAGTATASGIGDLFLHAKYNPLGDSGSFTFVLDPYIKLPTAGGGLGNNHVEGGLVAPFSLDLGNNWSFAMTPEADVLLNGSGSGYHAQFVDVAGFGKSFGPLTLGAEVWTSQNLDPAGTVSQYSADVDVAYLLGNDTAAGRRDQLRPEPRHAGRGVLFRCQPAVLASRSAMIRCMRGSLLMVVCGLSTRMVSPSSESGRQLRQSTTPSSGLTMAVSGTGKGSAIRSSEARPSALHSSAAACASGPRGDITGRRMGLPSVMTRATPAGGDGRFPARWCRQADADRDLAWRAAASISCRSTAGSTCGRDPG